RVAGDVRPDRTPISPSQRITPTSATRNRSSDVDGCRAATRNSRSTIGKNVIQQNPNSECRSPKETRNPNHQSKLQSETCYPRLLQIYCVSPRVTRRK